MMYVLFPTLQLFALFHLFTTTQDTTFAAGRIIKHITLICAKQLVIFASPEQMKNFFSLGIFRFLIPPLQLLHNPLKLDNLKIFLLILYCLCHLVLCDRSCVNLFLLCYHDHAQCFMIINTETDLLCTHLCSKCFHQVDF